MKSTREKVSYCIGLEAGGNIRRQFKDVDQNLLKKGLSQTHVIQNGSEYSKNRFKRAL